MACLCAQILNPCNVKKTRQSKCMEVGFKTQPPCVYSAYGASHPSLSVYGPLCSGSCDGTINKCFLGVFCMGVHYIGTCMSTLTCNLHTIPSLYPFNWRFHRHPCSK